MKIYIGADHRGYSMKEQLKSWLISQGQDVIDCGNDHLDPDDDYVDFGLSIARKITEHYAHSHDEHSAIGIGLCGSGVGVSIIGNRIKGVRCSLSMSPDHARHARENDHANMLALASEYIDLDTAKDIITTFMKSSPRRVEKYLRRVRKLDSIKE